MVNILILNGWRSFALLEVAGFRVTTESSLGNDDGYKAPAELLKTISEITKNRRFDCVIIQNNMGAGFDKAQAIDASMLEKTIIVWNSRPTDSDKAPYKGLGIKHFTDIHYFRECLDELIKGEKK